LFALWQPDSIRVMGDKSTARETMKKANVPTVPGSDGLLQVPCLATICLI
jgi:biotin carboxylase